MDGCLACDLTAGRTPLPGGVIHAAAGWVVEHCVGPLGVGTLIVKPERHVVHLADLAEDEAAAMGPLLTQAAQVVRQLADPDQVYVALWSHADARPGHIHFVVQPVDAATVALHDAHGPALQAAMFDAGRPLPHDAVEVFCERARQAWSDS